VGGFRFAVAGCSFPRATLAAKGATTTIPIVFVVGSDPVKEGLVASFNRPGGNITGVSIISSALVSKQFELLHELVPQAAVVGILVNPSNPNVGLELSDLQRAAQTMGVQVAVLRASTESEIEGALVTLMQLRAAALLIAPDVFFLDQREILVAWRNTRPFRQSTLGASTRRLAA
jgi:putative ABC transport system substrate-binding protein